MDLNCWYGFDAICTSSITSCNRIIRVVTQAKQQSPPLMEGVVGVVWPCDRMICDSSSLSSFLSSVSFQLEFLICVATWLSDFLSVDASFSFSAPSLIFSSRLISFLMMSLSSSSLTCSCSSLQLSVWMPYLWDSSYRTGCFMYSTCTQNKTTMSTVLLYVCLIDCDSRVPNTFPLRRTFDVATPYVR